MDADENVSFQKARQQHPTSDIMAMRLNETGTCGRIRSVISYQLNDKHKYLHRVRKKY